MTKEEPVEDKESLTGSEPSQENVEREDDEREDQVAEESKDSFPASDSPSY